MVGKYRLLVLPLSSVIAKNFAFSLSLSLSLSFSLSKKFKVEIFLLIHLKRYNLFHINIHYSE